MAKASSRSKSSNVRKGRRGRASRRTAAMVFSSRNYLLLLIGVLFIVSGYVLMRIENEVDGFLSLYIAPLLTLGGYLEVIYAILWRPKEHNKATNEKQT